MDHQYPIGSAPFGLDRIQQITLAERRGFGALPSVTAVPAIEMFSHEHQAQLQHQHSHAHPHQIHHHHGMPMPMSAPPTATGMSTPSGSQTPKIEAAASVTQWTQEDDRRLRAAVENVSCGRNGAAGSSANAAALSGTAGKSWQRIALVAFPNGPHDKDACAARWKALNQPSSIKGPWSKQEDKQLIRLVDQYGPERWVTIADKLGTRTGKQCRERWHNHVDPTINKTSFTPEEDAIIMSMYDKIGSKWAEMSKVLKGRPDNAIKNHYNTTLVRRRKLMEAVGKVNRAQTHHLEQVQQEQQLQHQRQQQEQAAAESQRHQQQQQQEQHHQQQQQQHEQQQHQQHLQQQQQQQQQQQFHHVQHHQILPPTPMSAPPMVHAQDPMFAAAMFEHRRFLIQQNENGNQGVIVHDGNMSSPYIAGGNLPNIPFRLEDQELDVMPRFAQGTIPQFEDRFGLGGSMMARSASIPVQSHGRLGLPVPLQRSTSYTNGFVPPPPAPGTFISPDEFSTYIGNGSVNADAPSFNDPSSIQFGSYGSLPHMVISSQESYSNLTPPPPPPGVSLDMGSQAHLQAQQQRLQMHESHSEGVAVPSSHQEWQLEHMMQLNAAASQQSLHQSTGHSQASDASGLYYGNMLGVSGMPASMMMGDHSPQDAFAHANLPEMSSATASPYYTTIPLGMTGSATTTHVQAGTVMQHQHSQQAAFEAQQQQQQQKQELALQARDAQLQEMTMQQSSQASASAVEADRVSPKTAPLELSDKPSKKRKQPDELTASESRDTNSEAVSASTSSKIDAGSSSSHRDLLLNNLVKLPSMPGSPYSPARQQSRERLPSLAAVAGAAEALSSSPGNAAARNRSRTSSLLGSIVAANSAMSSVDEKQKALLLPAFKQQMSASAHKAAAAAAVANVLAANGKDRERSGLSSPGGSGLSSIVHGTPSSASRLRSASQLSDCTGESPSRRMQAPPLKRTRLSSLSTDILPSTIASSNFNFSMPMSSSSAQNGETTSTTSPSKAEATGDTSISSIRSSGSSSSMNSSTAMVPALSADSSINSSSTGSTSMTLLMSPDDIPSADDYTTAKPLPSSSGVATSSGILGPSMLANFASFVLPPSLDGGVSSAGSSGTTDMFSHANLHNFGFNFGTSSPSGPSMTSSPIKDKSNGGSNTTSHMVTNLLGLHHAHQHQQQHQQQQTNNENDPSGGNSTRMTFGNSHLRIGSNNTGSGRNGSS
ncbi:hypothetical protein A4X13_0g1151 [Tilletia indica]|uniref:Uncharacterized protein n=1 Tax=Tilletia indica TaxID=43049 RepID=A0A8T8TFH8_9BASI|nr:hypothetical protein A4X13_0g1151 [Tilletia indica]